MRDRAAEPAARPHRPKPERQPAPSAQPLVAPAEARAVEHLEHRPETILGLQRVHGNHAVQRLLGARAPLAIQRQPAPGQSSGGATHTVTDPHASVRDGPDDFKPTGKEIPVGARVDVTKREVVDTKKLKGDFVNVVDHATGAPLGWTSRENLGDVQYAKAAASFVYVAKVQPREGHPDTIPVMVYVPPHFDGTKADIVLYFHGDAADYAADTANNYSRENPALGMQLATVASGASQIVIAPQINEYTPAGAGKVTKSPWNTLHAGDYDTIVQTVLTNLQGDLKLAAPIPRGAISIAGHSGGGKALGQAAKDLSAGSDAVTDITLVEAGYGGGEDAKGKADGKFAQSFQLVRDWLLEGKPGKVLRVITKASKAGTDTRSAIENTDPKDDRIPVLGIEGVRNAIKAKGRDGELEATATDIKTDPQKRTGGMVLVRTIVIKRKSGDPPQGTIDVFLMTDPPRDKDKVDPHFGVRDATLGAIVSGRGKSATFGVP